MRPIGRGAGGLAGLVLGVVAGSLPASAQQSSAAPKGPPPTIATCPSQVADVAICYSEKLPSGAYVLAAMPRTWNGNLIVFGHGGPAVVPPTATTSQGDLAKYSFAV